MGERENGRARGRHARGATSPLACLLLARPFFLVPTTSKRLLRRLTTKGFGVQLHVLSSISQLRDKYVFPILPGGRDRS